jgi:hypothetical protein
MGKECEKKKKKGEWLDWIGFDSNYHPIELTTNKWARLKDEKCEFVIGGNN